MHANPADVVLVVISYFQLLISEEASLERYSYNSLPFTIEEKHLGGFLTSLSRKSILSGIKMKTTNFYYTLLKLEMLLLPVLERPEDS